MPRNPPPAAPRAQAAAAGGCGGSFACRAQRISLGGPPEPQAASENLKSVTPFLPLSQVTAHLPLSQSPERALFAATNIPKGGRGKWPQRG